MTKPLEPVAKIAGCIICESPSLLERMPGVDPLLAFFALGCAATSLEAGVALCEGHHGQVHKAMRVLGFEERRAAPASAPKTEAPS